MTDQQAAQTDTGALLECPFCASTDIDPEGWASTERSGPACQDCGASADTVEIWNTRPALRATTPATAGAREERCDLCRRPILAGEERDTLSGEENGGDVHHRCYIALGAPPAQPAGGIANVIRKLRARTWIDCNKADAELDALAANLLERFASPGGGSREEVAGCIRESLGYHGIHSDLSEAAIERAASSIAILALRPSGPQAAEGDETPASIAAWQEATFGPPASNASYAVRALRELSELIQWLVDDDNHPEAGPEFADILICLSGAAHRMGLDLRAEVNRKMAINRARKWRMTGPGHGQHIPTDAQSGEGEA